MPVENKAAGVEGQEIHLNDNQTKTVCPCETFDQCSTRQPYGVDVWSGPGKIRAMGCLAYGVNGVINGHRAAVLRGLANQTNSRNPFFTNLKGILGNLGKPRVLAFPPVSDQYIDGQMQELAKELYNTAGFTNFQKSMILRANLVRNGTVMRSDFYEDKRENLRFPPQKLLPFCGSYPPEMWSVDHIRVESKGGCNRFCNATVLTRTNNCLDKNDKGAGCPCVCAINKKNKQESPADGQKDFLVQGKVKKKGKYALYECLDYFFAREEGEKVPAEIPGICDAEKKCNLDDPREFKLKGKSGTAKLV